MTDIDKMVIALLKGVNIMIDRKGINPVIERLESLTGKTHVVSIETYSGNAVMSMPKSKMDNRRKVEARMPKNKEGKVDLTLN